MKASVNSTEHMSISEAEEISLIVLNFVTCLFYIAIISFILISMICLYCKCYYEDKRNKKYVPSYMRAEDVSDSIRIE